MPNQPELLNSAASEAKSVESPREFNSLLTGYVLFSIIAIFGGIFVFNYRINGLVPAILGEQSVDDSVVEEDSELAAIAELQYLDTDNDGLSDFDETYTYFTSRNLIDTDGDGLSDGDEVQNGTNPNCAVGNNCSGIRALTDNTVATQANDEVVENILFDAEELNSEELRTELSKLGIPNEVLNDVGDDELREVYSAVRQEYLAADAATSSGITGNLNPEDDITVEDIPEETVDDLIPDSSASSTLGGATSVSDLQEYTPEQIRSLLLQGGVTQEELDQIDDATLLELYGQALDEQQN